MTNPPAPAGFELFRDRLRFAMNRASVRNTELAKAVGTSSAAIANMLTRENKAYRGPQTAKLSDALQVSSSWLAFNEGPPPGREFTAAVKTPSPQPSDSLTRGLSSLQCAALESMASLMRAGTFTDEEVIDLLATLKPRLSGLNRQS